MSTYSLLALLAAMAIPPASPPVGPGLTADERAAIRCSAAFALVAGAQVRGGARDYAPLDWRGREYMVLTGSGLTARGWNAAQVATAMRDAAGALQAAPAGGKPGANALDAVMPPCLALLDAAVPPLRQPTLPQCAAILRLAADEKRAVPGGAAEAQRLDAAADEAARRVRSDTLAQSRSAADADAVLAAEAAEVARVAALPGGIARYDRRTCFELAK